MFSKDIWELVRVSLSSVIEMTEMAFKTFSSLKVTKYFMQHGGERSGEIKGKI